MRKNIYIALLAFVCFGAKGQQNAQYTQYMYNTININPAYAGSRGSFSVFGLHRSQWVGLDGAPTSNAFSVHTPIAESKVGLGVSFVNDKLGVTEDNTVSVDFSYTIDLNNRDSKLSFGLKGSANFLNVEYSNLNIYNPNDSYFQNDIVNQFSPNIGAGVYWHNQSTYFGFSIPNFLETTRFEEGIQNTMKTKMHYYLMGGHIFEINPDLKFKPAFLLKAVSGAPLQADLSANFLLYDKFTFGGAYRLDAAWSALAGFQISDGLMVGYAYDGDTTKLARYNSGSHEIFLRFELFNRYKRVSSPRFF